MIRTMTRTEYRIKYRAHRRAGWGLMTPTRYGAGVADRAFKLALAFARSPDWEIRDLCYVWMEEARARMGDRTYRGRGPKRLRRFGSMGWHEFWY